MSEVGDSTLGIEASQDHGGQEKKAESREKTEERRQKTDPKRPREVPK